MGNVTMFRCETSRYTTAEHRHFLLCLDVRFSRIGHPDTVREPVNVRFWRIGQIALADVYYMIGGWKTAEGLTKVSSENKKNNNGKPREES